MKALVLNSGGVDSTTCVAIAVDKYGKDKVIATILPDRVERYFSTSLI